MNTESAANVGLASIDASLHALRVCLDIAKAWGLTDNERMTVLGVDQATLARFESGELRLDDATMERLSHIFAIYSALHVLLPIPERADTWIRRANSAPLFGGRTALDRMMDGRVADLFVVRQYLEAQLYC